MAKDKDNDKNKTKRVGFSQLMENQDSIQPPINEDNRAASAKTGINSLLSSSNITRTSRVIEQKRRFELPISKTTIEATLLNLDPNKTVVSSLNPRIQELMDRGDPKLIEMKVSLLENGQADPVWARPIKVDDEVWHEIIVGSTRRFLSLWINEERAEPITLAAWVGKIPDVDAKRMARVENNDRRDLSFWEKCIDAKNNSLDPAVSSMPVDSQAKIIGMSAGAYSEALSTVNVIPKPFIERLLSPNLMRAKSARRMIASIKDIKKDDKYVEELFVEHVLNVMGSSKVEDISILESAIESVGVLPWVVLKALSDPSILRGQNTSFISKAIDMGVSPDKLVLNIKSHDCNDIEQLKQVVSAINIPVGKKTPWVKRTGKTIRAKVTPHRNNAGQYKVDLYNMDAGEIDKIKTFIDNEL